MEGSSISELSLQNLFSVKGKKVIVTGGTKGVGFMIAAGFVVTARRLHVFGRETLMKKLLSAFESRSGESIFFCL